MSQQRDTILIVDDREINRAILRSIFASGYNLLEAENGRQAMTLIDQYHSRLAVLLLDIVMPVMDGYAVLTELGRRGLLAELPVIVITAENSAENEVRAFDLGAADIIAKPFEPHVVRRRVQNIINLNLHKFHQEELIARQAASIRAANDVMIDALSSIIEYRSLETGQHIHRISLITRLLLEDVRKNDPEYLLDERAVELITSASPLHDIGKIAIPDAILNKPGKLTADEYEIMKTHAVKGAEMLTRLERMGDRDYLRYAYSICRYHHERWDGRGYPDGIKGDAIPLCAQVVGMADCYDALTNDRVYKKALPVGQAISMILNGECGAFSPRLLESLKNVRGALAALTAEYMDAAAREGGSAPAPAPVPALPAVVPELGGQSMAQMKYFTLLRQLDATVMEVDFNTGVYHVVYLAGENFRPLCTGATFAEAFENFAKTAVCPQDRDRVHAGLDAYVEEMFSEGLMSRQRRYRVISDEPGRYVWCRATLLRVDTEVPHQRRALILWQVEEVPPVSDSTAVARAAEQELLQNAIGGVLCCRMDAGFTMAGVPTRLLSLLGYTAQEMEQRFGNRYLELIYPADRADVQRQLRSQMNHGRMAELEYRLVARGGDLIWVLDKTLCLSSGDGERKFYFILVDITKSRRTQQELRLVSERYQLLLEKTNDVIFEWDAARDSLTFSRNFAEKYGYEPICSDALERLTQASHLHPDDRPQITQLVQNMRSASKFSGDLELRLAGGDGRYRWCWVRLAPQYGEDGSLHGVVGVLTEMKRPGRRAGQLPTAEK